MHEVIQRFRLGGLAALFTLAAGLSLVLLSRVRVIEQNDHTLLYQVAAGILIIASVGPLIDALKPYAELLVWNGAGWSVGLAILGLDTVGAMPLWPIMLAALALTFWPRSAETQLPATAIVIAALGGALVCWLAWENPELPFDMGDFLEGL